MNTLEFNDVEQSELIHLMDSTQLTASDVAERIAVSPWTVKLDAPKHKQGLQKDAGHGAYGAADEYRKSFPPELETPISDDDLPTLNFYRVQTH